MLQNLYKPLDFTGGCVDNVFLMLPKILKPFAKTREADKQTYLDQVEFYVDQGYTEDPASFFNLPDSAPGFHSMDRESYLDGHREHITWESKYKVKNLLIHDQYTSYLENRTAHLLRWTHGDLAVKPWSASTAICSGSLIRRKRCSK